VLDIETVFSMVEKVKKVGTTYKKVKESDRGNAFNDDNYIVCAGSYNSDGGYIYTDFSDRRSVEELKERVGRASHIVGHNIKFDMHHLRRCGFDFSHCTIIDTMIDEYLLSGGTAIFSGLDKLAPKYGGTSKIDVVKQMWEAGINTDEIPQSVLKKYLYGDVWNTWMVREGQKKRFLTSSWCVPMAKLNYDLNSVTADMEYQGLCVDVEVAKDVKAELDTMQREAERALIDVVADNTPLGLDVDLSSKKQLSQLLYSRKLKTFEGEAATKQEIQKLAKENRAEWKEWHDRYSRTPKGQRSQKRFLEALDKHYEKLTYGFNITPTFEFCGKTGLFVSKIAMELLRQKKLSKKATEFIEVFLHKGKCDTWIGLNYWSIAQNTSQDGRVHCNFNQAGTRSGRYSSSKPNMQQLPSAKNHNGKNRVRAMIVSRYGDDGVILCPDYSQLELRIAMEIAKSKEGFQDYRGGIDIHGGRASWAYNARNGEGSYEKLPEKEQASLRGQQKAVNFGLLYGAMPKGGIEEDMYNAFFDRYKDIQTWSTRATSEIELHQRYTSTLTGFRYNFTGANRSNFYRGYDSSGKGWRNKAFNYPVQGDSGRIVQVAMIGIHQAIVDESQIHFCAQIHDEVLLDVHKDSLDKAKEICQYEMSDNIRARFKEYFNYDIEIPLDIDMEYGTNWYDVRT